MTLISVSHLKMAADILAPARSFPSIIREVRQQQSLQQNLVAQFLDFGVVSAHIRSSRLGAGAGLSRRGLVFAPALLPNREAVALHGRVERAGACDEPLQRDRR